MGVTTMTKRCIKSLVFISIIVLFIYLQYGREIKVETTTISLSDGFMEQKITIVANKLFIINKENFAKKLLEKCRENSFNSILFSYDINGYPNSIQIYVYTNPASKKLNKNYFTIVYEANMNRHYNIKDNPDKFKIKIR